MRIHIQNPENDPPFDFSWEQWQAAATRAGDLGAGHGVTIGRTTADGAAALRDAEIFVGDVAAIRAQLPLRAPRLKIVQATVAGIDGLTPFDWVPEGVALWTNRGIHAGKAGEFGIMSVLMLASRVPEFFTHQRAGQWQKLYGSVLAGRRLTVVGLGALGGSVARHAKYFGMHVTGVRTEARKYPDCDVVIAAAALEKILPTTEFLLLAAPLTAATRNIMTRERLKMLPRGAGLINIGRGALVDQDAVCDLLDSGHLGGAVLDVFVPEPVPANHRLWTTKNLVISPHTCADDPKTYNPMTLDLLFDNLRARQEGRAAPTEVDFSCGF